MYGPDGRRIFFSRTTGNLRKGTLRNELDVFYLGRAAGTTLFHSPDAFEMPVRPVSIGLDGEYVLVDGGGPIWLVPLQAGRNRVLTTPPTDGSDHSPLVSPDGRQVAFARMPDGGVSDVYLVNVEGTRLSRLTTTPTPPRGTPKVGVTPLAWSPDATRLLVFRHDRLAIVDVATGESTDVGQVGVRFWIASARWFGAPPVPSSRGTIVFERSAEGGTADLYTVRADGTDLHRLTANLRSYDPAWSPSGDRIAFTGGGTLDRQLFVMNADGSGTTQLTQLAPREGAWDPFWYRADPFGLRIAFKLITRPPGAIETTSVLYGIDPDGKGAAPIAAPGDLTQRSPDGRRIVKLLYTGGLHGSLIVVSDVDGTGVCTIGWGWSPAWSPDGSSIVYGAGDGLFTRRADGLGPPRRLTRAGKLELDLSPSWTE